ncbi:MAG: hypothetical protein KIT30_05790 [Cyclobacteriaceae bacterium]|nr:hypothetical protein [Cyclobacteriaceae bacterium]
MTGRVKGGTPESYPSLRGRHDRSNPLRVVLIRWRHARSNPLRVVPIKGIASRLRAFLRFSSQ